MKFNFKKIASVLSSAVMMSSTVALAAAANFPAPYVQGGVADVAVVYGSSAATTDLIASVDIQSALADELAKQTASSGGATTASVSGEAYALFGSKKVYHNDTLNSQRSSVTDSNMPILLADTAFSGNKDADLTHTIKIGVTPRLVFSKQPTDDDDPQFNLKFSDTATSAMYNATVTFDKTINFTDSNSEGEKIELFGQSFTVGSATDNNDLVLFKQANTLFLSSDANPSEEVAINGATYIVELAAASDDAATIKVTDSAGNSDQKEINEAASKKIVGVEVSVNLADESTATDRITAEITVGAEKVKLTDGSEVTTGTDDTAVDGTRADFSNAALASGTTSIEIQVGAVDSDVDALLPGDSFVDPVFGSFKVQFAGLAGDGDRESIKVSNSGDDKMTVNMTDYRGESKNVNWVYNESSIAHPGAALSGIPILGDSSGDLISVVEMEVINRTHYAVIGNEDEGRLIEITSITNASQTGEAATGSGDKIAYKDVFSGDTNTVEATSEGSADLDIGANIYTVTYVKSGTEEYIRINDPDSAGNAVNLFGTIQSNKGAKVAFYQPTLVNLGNWTGDDTDVTSLRFPDGDGYTAVTISGIGAEDGDSFNVTAGSTTTALSAAGGTNNATAVTFSIGQLTYNITATSNANESAIYLQDADSAPIRFPALVVFEEEDDNNVYEAMIVRLEGDGTDADGLGVNTVDRTSFSTSGYGPTSLITHEVDNDLQSFATLWGTVITKDNSESDQSSVTLSYPNEQVHAEVYIAAEATTITGGSSSSGSVVSLGNVLVTDSEAGSVSNKNLIVVGGSCINSVAADLLGGGFCGADFESETGVGAGSFLIETFSRSSGKVATLVAGYNAGDTTNGATYLTTQTVDTAVGSKYTGTSATSASMVTDTTA